MGFNIATDSTTMVSRAANRIALSSAQKVNTAQVPEGVRDARQVSFSPDTSFASEDEGSARSSPTTIIYTPDSDCSAIRSDDLWPASKIFHSTPYDPLCPRTDASPRVQSRSKTSSNPKSCTRPPSRWRKVLFAQPNGRASQRHVLDLAIAPAVSAVWAHAGAPTVSDGVYYPLGPNSAVYFEGEPGDWLKEGFIPESDCEGALVDVDEMVESMKTIWMQEQVLKRVIGDADGTSKPKGRTSRGKEDERGVVGEKSGASSILMGGETCDWDLGASPSDYWGPSRSYMTG